MDVMTLTFVCGIITGCTIIYIMSVIHNSICKRKQRKAEQKPKYEVIKLDDGGSEIPKTASGNNYNHYLDNYDRHIRKCFECYIKNHESTWWKEYEKQCIENLVPIERTLYKYVKCVPLRLKGAVSSDYYTCFEMGSFKIEARPVTYFDDYNMEIKITNTDIKENEDGNQIQKTQGI